MEKKIIDLEIIDELTGSGVDAIALVDSPAIEKNFMYFNAETEVFADYPWDQCIQDQKDRGLSEDSANNICGWIRSQNMEKIECAKVSFDFDDTLSTNAGLELAMKHKRNGDTLYIISARSTVGPDMLARASKLGIPESRIFATGSNLAKVAKVRDLNIAKHIDNNKDVINSLAGIGQKFEINTGGLAPYTNQSGPLKKKSVALHNMMFADEDKMELVGPVAIPDIQIPRKNEKTKEIYFVRFSKEVVCKMAEKFMREQRLADNNIQHVDNADAGSYVFESWLVETPEDKANTVYGLDVPVGTWCVKMRVTNLDTWAKVKSGELKGFSLQGNFVSEEEYEAYLKDKTTYDELKKLVSSF